MEMIVRIIKLTAARVIVAEYFSRIYDIDGLDHDNLAHATKVRRQN